MDILNNSIVTDADTEILDGEIDQISNYLSETHYFDNEQEEELELLVAKAMKLGELYERKKWQAAKAQAVPAKLVLELEKGRFKEYEFKALLRQSLRASKVTRSKLNWVHVMGMLGTGSTVAHRICEALGVNPDGTEFKAQEPAND